MASPTVPLDLILSEGQGQGHPDFESQYPAKEPC